MTKKSICVIGDSGLLGAAICNSLQHSYTLHGANSRNCDVTVPSQVEKYFSKIESLYGLVYCSVLKNDADSLQNSEILRGLLEVNLFGAIACMQAAARKMRNGKIIVIGSVDGTFGNYKKTMYAVSKAALHEYTRCFACQVKDNIEVLCLVPGTITTEEDKIAVVDFVKAFMDNKIRNLHAQLIRIDGGHHTFPL